MPTSRFMLFGRAPRAPLSPSGRPDWMEANPIRIARALERASQKPSGGWAVLDATDRIHEPRAFTVAGRELVAWKGEDGVRVAPEACPHMGASLCDGHVDDKGRIVCPWHGLALGGRRGNWAPLTSYDDGVLTWVRMPELLNPGETPLERPVLTARPRNHLSGVIRLEARCEPRDVIANRLDPWHGVHFHPHSFLRLRVLEEGADHITVRVVYKVIGPLAMEVDARFDCPDPRTIVMTIVDGDGTGSVVETHATPIDAQTTAVIEATLATSDRPGFGAILKAQRAVRPLIERRAAKLWVEDRDYAERTYALRQREVTRLPVVPANEGTG